MTKSEITKQLKNMDCEIAEIICDIKTMSDVSLNQSVLVFLVKEPSNDDLIKPSMHWYVCNNIKELTSKFAFNDEDAKLKFQNLQIVNVKEIREFETDFA